MEKNYINGVKINIIKEIILMELKKEKEKLNFLMEKNLFVILKMENRMELVFLLILKEMKKKFSLLMENLIKNIKKTNYKDNKENSEKNDK